MMDDIVVTEDDLRRLEKRFGSAVRLMGSWNSDGTFGYTSVPLSAVRRAAEDLMNPDVIATLSRPKHMPERTSAFLELLNTCGSPLIAALQRTGNAPRKERGTVARLHSRLTRRNPDRWYEPRQCSPIPRLLPSPPERLAQAGCSYCELYDARTDVPVPVMPMLRHLRRQMVKFSGTGDLSIASRRWTHA